MEDDEIAVENAKLPARMLKLGDKKNFAVGFVSSSKGETRYGWSSVLTMHLMDGPKEDKKEKCFLWWCY